MSIEVKISKTLVSYKIAMKFLDKRVEKLKKNKGKELLWVLEHPTTYTAGIRSNTSEIIDKNIKIINTKRGGKITLHNPGQKIIYLVLDLNRRKKDIRNFIRLIEKTIIETINEFGIKTFNDKKNIGIWYKDKSKIKKVATIGLKVSKWIAYHGFAINIKNDLTKYNDIIPCGISDREVTNLKTIKNQNYNNFKDKLIINFSKNLEA